MVFLPKGELDNDYLQIRREPAATRPISMSNTDAKIFAMVLNHKLSQLAQLTVIEQQRGFVRGRRMSDNLVEIDSLALHLDQNYNTGSGVILFDFASAFPSLSHDYIFAALHRLGVPPMILRALHSLYQRCRASVAIDGCDVIFIEIFAGIKQGCPASGSVFALALDPFVRMMCLRLPKPLNTVTAFADDLAVVAVNLLAALRDLYPDFATMLAASGLRLNAAKTLVLPIGSMTEHKVRRFLVEQLVEWTGMTIARFGRLLGISIGPEGGGTDMGARLRQVLGEFSRSKGNSWRFLAGLAKLPRLCGIRLRARCSIRSCAEAGAPHGKLGGSVLD
jgi:hypothetical protein